jgi:hypothetical protein
MEAAVPVRSIHAQSGGTEGGFLGFGGVAVSDAEKAALTDVTAVSGAASN